MAESGRAHTRVKKRTAGSDDFPISHTHTHRCTHMDTDTHRSQRKDTRHGERLSEGMEGAAPGDLPGRDVNQDEMELQEQLTHLQQHTTFETLSALHSCASPRITIMSYFMFPFNITRPPCDGETDLCG